MQPIIGNLRKLKSEFQSPVDYYLRIGDLEIPLNTWLGQFISFRYTHTIHCIQCQRKTNKSFQQGFCYSCLRKLMECDLCMIFPERCHVQQGTCPTDDWAHAHCHQAHIVYLANASGLKVGITRETQIPTRWIDQGAKQALPIFKVANRYQAGCIEVVLKQFVSDRTNWRAMLGREVVKKDLKAERDVLLKQAESPLNDVFSAFAKKDIVYLEDNIITELDYPILQYPKKIQSLSLDKTPEVQGKLQGIKGQYLLLDTGVINIRKFGGYEVECQLC